MRCGNGVRWLTVAVALLALSGASRASVTVAINPKPATVKQCDQQVFTATVGTPGCESPGAKTYAWSTDGDVVAGGGSGDDTITVRWHAAGSGRCLVRSP